MNFQQFALNNVKRNFKTYLAYFLSSVFSVMVFFSFSMSAFHPVLSNLGQGSLRLAMTTAEIVIYIFSFLFVLYSVNTFLNVRSKEFGVLMILGMSKEQFKGLVFLENMIIGGLSIVTGIILGLVFSKFFLMIMGKIIDMKLFNFYFPLKAIALTFIVFIFLFFIISMVTPLLIRANKINEMLKGAKKIDKEIKFSKLVSIVSILLLSLAYMLACLDEFNGVNNSLYNTLKKINEEPYLITALVVVGTYLFFTQFSICIIHLLKRNRKFYMKKTNMLWISDLAYRIKTNARMLFLVTILSTVTFTSISALYVLTINVKNETVKNFPLPFDYFSFPGDVAEKSNTEDIENIIKNNGHEYKKYTATILKENMNANSIIYILSESEYNKFAEVLNMKKVSLNKEQTYLVPSNHRFKVEKDKFLSEKDLSLNGVKDNLKTIGVGEKNIFLSGMFSHMAVVNDDVFKILENTGEKIRCYAYDVPNWENTVHLAEIIKNKYPVDENPTHLIHTAADNYQLEKYMKKLMLFVGFFVSLIFFIEAGSFLYFRLYTDLNEEKEKYKNISKIGLTIEELKRTSTIQIAVLFFVPYVLASIHTYFAMRTIRNLLFISLNTQLMIVLLGFFIVQFVYFMIIRSRYIYYLSKHIS